MMNAIKAISCFMVLVMMILAGNCSKSASTPATRQIQVIHAGSLAIPFKEMAGAFMKKFPGYEVLLEAYGSRTCARQITDLKRQVDVMASADSAVIRDLLMPRYADFCIDFTTNEMVIMFTDKSRYAEAINSQNWYDILLKPEVQYGHSDPNSDPCGYRALLTWQLAEKYYKSENLYYRLKEKMPAKNLRPKEVDLIALLEGGEVDYIFIYRSVAQQHQAKYLLLPEEINLKSPQMADFYRTASLRITGKRPGEEVEIKGEAMVYGITIPKNAPDPEGGIRFLSFVLGKEGQEIMKKNGQPEIIPPRVDHKEKLPEALKGYFRE
jgi:molybdate/tungstate transport system substrate-binding protein